MKYPSQRRLTFLWNHHYFEIYVYTAPQSAAGTVVLNCQVCEGPLYVDSQLISTVHATTLEIAFHR